jgi:hypothetical protein
MQFTEYQKLIYRACPDLLKTFPGALDGDKKQAWLLECWFKAHYPNEIIGRDRMVIKYLVNKYGK